MQKGKKLYTIKKWCWESSSLSKMLSTKRKISHWGLFHASGGYPQGNIIMEGLSQRQEKNDNTRSHTIGAKLKRQKTLNRSDSVALMLNSIPVEDFERCYQKREEHLHR